jgi:hypothetical protein
MFWRSHTLQILKGQAGCTSSQSQIFFSSEGHMKVIIWIWSVNIVNSLLMVLCVTGSQKLDTRNPNFTCKFLLQGATWHSEESIA